MLRIVPHTVTRVGRSHEHLPDGFELRFLQPGVDIFLNKVDKSGEWQWAVAPAQRLTLNPQL
jgi:hypothetical protein